MLRNDAPLFLPPGSVRSVLSLLIVAGYLFGYVTEDITVIVLGFYFISRNHEGETPRDV